MAMTLFEFLAASTRAWFVHAYLPFCPSIVDTALAQGQTCRPNLFQFFVCKPGEAYTLHMSTNENAFFRILELDEAAARFVISDHNGAGMLLGRGS